jgi:hypothetical protein
MEASIEVEWVKAHRPSWVNRGVIMGNKKPSPALSDGGESYLTFAQLQSCGEG